MKSKLLELSIDDIQFGQDHPGLAVNARKSNRDVRLEELTASIRAEGLLQPLLVWREHDDANGKYVVDGSRRLMAIRAINHDGGAPFVDSETVPCLVIWDCTAEEALQKSIAGFSTTMPPHPIDQFEAFAALRAEHPENETEAMARAIAERYGVTPGLVMRRLALGNLHPTIREAWRGDVIDQKGAIAFTLLRDPERQLSIFNALKKKKSLTDWSIRREIVGDNSDVPKFLKLVTPEQYERMGGEIYRDLFTEKEGTGDGVSDVVLLKDAARAIVEAKIAELLGDGWAWADTIDNLPLQWSHAFTRKHLKKSAGPKERDGAGCVISITDAGKLEIEYGVIKAEERKKAQPSEGKKRKTDHGEKDQPGEAPFPSDMKLPNKMVLALQRQATLAMAKAILDAPGDVVLMAIAASIAAGGAGHSPIGVAATGMTDRESGVSTDTADFGKTFGNLRKKGRAAALDALTSAVSGAMDLVVGGEPLPFEEAGAKALAAAIPAKSLNEALRKAFDHKAYFEGAGKPFLHTAILEALGAESLDKVAKGSKAELAKFCIQHVAKTRWLPPELRAPNYDGPRPSPRRAFQKGERPKKAKR